jgi:trimethylamine--corrinoid protein Co-methyltransferase
MTDAAIETGRRKRGGGRSGNTRRGGLAIAQLPWRIPEILDSPTEPLPPEGVAAIDNGAMRILEEIGIDFLHDEAKAHLKAAGADVDPVSNRVRFDRAMVREMVARAPSSFTITPRNPDRQVTVGGRSQLFVNVSSPPNCSDLDRGRRAGTHESYRDLIKLPGRAGRYPPLDPPPRLHPRQAGVDRQGDPRLQPGHRAGRGRHGNGPHRQRPEP